MPRTSAWTTIWKARTLTTASASGCRPNIKSEDNFVI